MSELNSYMIPGSNGELAKTSGGEFPAFASQISNSQPPATSTPNVDFSSQESLEKAMASGTLPRGEYVQKASAALAKLKSDSETTKILVDREKRQQLLAEKAALESGRVSVANPGARVGDINKALGLTSDHRGSGSIGKF